MSKLSRSSGLVTVSFYGLRPEILEPTVKSITRTDPVFSAIHRELSRTSISRACPFSLIGDPRPAILFSFSCLAFGDLDLIANPPLPTCAFAHQIEDELRFGSQKARFIGFVGHGDGWDSNCTRVIGLAFVIALFRLRLSDFFSLTKGGTRWQRCKRRLQQYASSRSNGSVDG